MRVWRRQTKFSKRDNVGRAAQMVDFFGCVGLLLCFRARGAGASRRGMSATWIIAIIHQIIPQPAAQRSHL